MRERIWQIQMLQPALISNITLSDLRLVQDAVVREAAVDALVALYNNEDNVLPLHEFVTRFRARIGELIYDIDDSVAVKGVRVSSLCFQRALQTQLCQRSACEEAVPFLLHSKIAS